MTKAGLHKTVVSGRHCGMSRAWNLILDAVCIETFQLWKYAPHICVCMCVYMWGVLGATVVKNSPASEGDERDTNSIPGFGRFPGVGSGNPLQYSCLESSMDR